MVNLGEGLQTSFWRVGDPTVRWVSVDLEPVIDVRRRLLPADPQIIECPTSALDRSWFDAVPDDQPVLIIAEGLFMYFPPDDVWALLSDMAALCRRRSGVRLDPHWFSKKTLAGLDLTKTYRTPPMPFALTVDEAAAIPKRVPRITDTADVMLPKGRGCGATPHAFLRELAADAQHPAVRDGGPLRRLAAPLHGRCTRMSDLPGIPARARPS